MTFGNKLKQLRTDNNLTQDELAQKIYVTRTAVSKWETDKGYPGIESLKQLSTLFRISIDELISDVDVENQRLLEEARARKFYWCAIACLVFTTVCTLVAYFARLPYLSLASITGVIGYVVFGLFSKPKYKRLSAKKMILPYLLSRLVIFLIVIALMISTILQLGG